MWNLIFTSSIKFCQNTLWGKPHTLAIPQAKSTAFAGRVSGCRRPNTRAHSTNPCFWTSTAGVCSPHPPSQQLGDNTNGLLPCIPPWSYCSIGCAECHPDAAVSPQGGPGTHIFTTDLIPAAVGNEEMPDVTPFVNFKIKIAVFIGQKGWISMSNGAN